MIGTSGKEKFESASQRAYEIEMNEKRDREKIECGIDNAIFCVCVCMRAISQLTIHFKVDAPRRFILTEPFYDLKRKTILAGFGQCEL